MSIIRDRCPRCNWLNIRSDEAQPFQCANDRCDSDFERRYPTPQAKDEAMRLAGEALVTAIVRPKLEGHVVYYIRWADRIKIGTTGNLQQRLRVLYHDELLTTEPGGMTLERERHQQFAHLLVNGQTEWFHMAPELLAHIERLRRMAA